MLKINENSDEYIFRVISRGRKSKLSKQNVPTSYTRIREIFIRVLKAVGLELNDFKIWRWDIRQTENGSIENDLKILLLVSRRSRKQQNRY